MPPAPDPEEITGNVANLVARGRGLILPVETVARATKCAKEVKAEDQPGDEDKATRPPAWGRRRPAKSQG